METRLEWIIRTWELTAAHTNHAHYALRHLYGSRLTANGLDGFTCKIRKRLHNPFRYR